MSFDFLKIMRERFACKAYKDKRISDKDLYNILEVGRLSPTSFGLEMVHFHVIKSKHLKEELFEACFNQQSTKEADITIITSVYKEQFYDPTSNFIKQRGERFPDGLAAFIDDFKGYYEFLKSNNRLLSWARSQGYIAVANQMSYAQSIGISSCAIEGYDEDKIIKLLKLDPSIYSISLLATYGYRNEEVREKIREDLDKIVTIY